MHDEESARMRSEPRAFTDLSVHVAPGAKGGLEIALFGELDGASAGKLDDALGEASAGEGPVVIDMRACGFVDSKGVAVLIKAAVHLGDQDRDVIIRGAKDRVVRVLEVAGITSMRHLTVEP
jgi:anti-anti-sigma factor